MMTVEATRTGRKWHAPAEMDEGAKAPDALKSIGEVADELDIPAYVLRFWETKFPRLTPVKCRGGRRYYRPADVQFLTRVKELLYSEGFTIKGARQYLAKNRKELMVETMIEEADTVTSQPSLSSQPASPQMDFFSRPVLTPRQIGDLHNLLQELTGLQDMLKPYVY